MEKLTLLSANLVLKLKKRKKAENDKIFVDVDFLIHKKSNISQYVFDEHVKASYNTTIEDFKLLVCQVTEFFPYQQELIIESTKVSLDNDMSTLFDYGVTPYTIFYVRCLSEEEALNKMMIIDEPPSTQSSRAEVGFDGSILLKQSNSKITSPREEKEEPIESVQEIAIDSSDNITAVTAPSFLLNNGFTEHYLENESIEIPKTNGPYSSQGEEFYHMQTDPENPYRPTASKPIATQNQDNERKEWPWCGFCTYENLDPHHVLIRTCEVCGSSNEKQI
jgi:hypothetical protein